jgi:tRNA C32,U32 (ribose-2'-O)-methylase TrmJ
MAKRKPGGKAPSVILINPKFAVNVGNVLRACSCWGIPQLTYTGDRIAGELAMSKRLPREERMKGYQDVDLCACDYPFERLPADAVPVAVELREHSIPLTFFEHPEKAVYVFGPEDGGLGNVEVRECHHFVVLPTAHCLNLAAAVNVVLAHRRITRQLAGLETTIMSEILNEHRGMIQ